MWLTREKGSCIRKSKVTIKEIAEMAGESIATVSHDINRTTNVRPELVDKIEKINEETGY
ncbi:LacI family DNA-binding transcriptional regulator, partial [Coprococcus eutactus]|uniref:LacI family DNA-binding transcriptional regulator n=1 Tax=Coprococcus eutactus TaxID=33043 RepID=UPI00210BE654